ncbi:hypothetical protein RB601_006179 [Gaeumannomyces tritici]
MQQPTRAAAALDPSLGGMRLPGGPAQILALGNGSYQRPIRAHDAISNQPQDHPFLQRAAAKSITAALSPPNEIGTSWIPRSITRVPAGWTFEFVCKDSLQEWKRQFAKGVALPVVGLSSGKDGLDAVNMSRPAFDCRGTVTVLFNRQAKQIEVKYHHTPLHKTVADLLDFFTPPPEPVTHKRPLDGEGEGADGASPQKKKRRKSQKTADQQDGGEGAEGGEDGSVIDGTPAKTPKRKRPSKPKKPKTPAGSLPGTTGGTNAAATNPDGSAAAVASGDDFLNLPPGEAARRREVANNLLSGSGIDPATLSEEQFNIFSNQSPDLQQESLAMLVKYGAERLRIVHPANASSDTQASQPSASSLVDASPAPEAADSAKKTARPRKSGAGAEAGTPSKAKPPKLTRGRCDGCKDKNIKCSKIKPACSECQAEGIECVYQLQQTKGPRGQKSDKFVQESPEIEEEIQVQQKPDEQVEQEEPSQEQQMQTQQPEEEEEEEEEPDDLPSPGFSRPAGANSWNQTATPDLSTYQHQVETVPTTAGLAFPQDLGGYVDHTSIHVAESVPAEPEPEPEVHHVQHVEPIQQSMARVSRSSSGRHSLPTGQRSQTAVVPPAAVETTASSSAGWHLPVSSAASMSSTLISADSTAAAALGYHMRTRSRTSLPSAGYASQAITHHGLPDIPALPQAAPQRQSQPSPEVPTYQQPVSQPIAQPSRSGSRQSQRPLSRNAHTVQAPSRDRQQQNQQHQQQTQAATKDRPAYGSSTAEATNASGSASAQDPYAQYYNTLGTDNTATTAADQSNTNIAYTPYSNQPAPTAASTYNYDTSGYNTRSHASQSYSNPVSQAAVSASYTTAGANNTSQWPSQTAQTRSSQVYNTNTATNATTNASSNSRNAHPGTSNSPALQGYNVRPQSNSPHTRSASRASYHQQQQQHHQVPQAQPQAHPQRHQRQQQQQQQPPQKHQQQGYGSYLQQPQQDASSNHQQQQPQQRQQQQQQQQQQQSWYGFTAANSSNGYGATNNLQQSSASGAYGATHAGGGSSSYAQQQQQQQQQQQHRSVNLQGSTYGTIEASDALYSLLQNNQGH